MEVTISEIISKCVKRGVKVYPVRINKKWKVQVDNNGKKTTYPKEVEYKNLNEALTKTYEYYYHKV